jgi:hypothetical protein
MDRSNIIPGLVKGKRGLEEPEQDKWKYERNYSVNIGFEH